MVAATVELRSIDGTEAALGWAGGHTIVVDRPEGRAGGMGLGFNGAQLLGLALGGCFCNDLRYAAEAMTVKLGRVAVAVMVEMEGSPLVAVSASMRVSCETLDGSDPQALIAEAEKSCMVGNSLRRGVSVSIESAA